jgi:hypothetical protein
MWTALQVFQRKFLCPSSGQKRKLVGKNVSLKFRRADGDCSFPVLRTVFPIWLIRHPKKGCNRFSKSGYKAYIHMVPTPKRTINIINEPARKP